MPIYFVHVVRLPDNLTLSATLDDDANSTNLIKEARRFYPQLSNASAPRLSFKLQAGTIHISTHQGFFSVCATDLQFETRTAYEFLDSVNSAFYNEYGGAITAAEREYVFMDFHQTLDLLRSRYMKIVADQNLGMLQNELDGVRQTMTNNVKSALIMHDKLGEVESMSQNLVNSAGMFANESKNLNRMHLWRTYGRPTVIISIVVLVYYLVSLII
ncbi:Synaptobrevin family protein [Tritrichomonas foetus]|uniref:Synaptobrevin family protein n=1 Tax=Tritrichomonas foetus TaxID=1144522 RepID=A0A1J4KA18_9EUKA|nr:Synaptobrevin family protein [Tritrichomonas foetus]|eukprot:OHT07802.1 Synaptobrevin family protein [Tritrichomonas foetus]